MCEKQYVPFGSDAQNKCKHNDQYQTLTKGNRPENILFHYKLLVYKEGNKYYISTDADTKY